ncbi:MAG: orotate phosphoribosyltransferase [Streptococcaceae bacterium]|jgi:orotate phosphoribosyltransferase|nr:orotate phosphoribosyltransferase [Streptococcaceae bacterium]
MTTDLATQIAKDLLSINAVTLSPSEPYTWASGIKSPIYTDNRVTLAYPEVRTRIEDGFVEKIRAEFLEVEVIAGTATAGIPHGAIIADKMNLPFAYIRSKPKDHGAGNQVEGKVSKGQKMVIIEDLISTGGSVLEAAAAAEREGADVLGIAAIFSYELPRADQNFSQAQRKLVTLTNYSHLIEIAQKTGYVTDSELILLKKFKENQESWQANS